MPPRYAELRCKSNFSFLAGASHPEELVDRAAELGLSGLAVGAIIGVEIVAKNGILMLDFVEHLREAGHSLEESLVLSGRRRLRPVLMTALSTLLGGLPLILGAGAGAESRAALGWVVFGGLGFATVFTLFLTPMTFVALGRFSRPRATEETKLAQELAAAPARAGR